MSQRDSLKCPKCGADKRLETRYEELRVSAEIQYGGGQGAMSMMHGVHPDQRKDVARTCPDVKLDHHGSCVFDNKSHRKRSLSQLRAAGFA
jgi:hypothetical protein